MKDFAGKVEAIKKKTVNAVSDVMSVPKKATQAMRGHRFDSERKMVKLARSYKGAPDFDDKGVTNAFKARSLSDGIRRKYAKKGVK